MSTPTPAEPTPATVVADVHQALDTAKADATSVVTAAEHLDFGDLVNEAKQIVHDGVELIKERISALFGHGTPTADATPTEASPTV